MQWITRAVGAAIWVLSGAFASVHAADVPARLLVGGESIEALLRLPGDLELGRYEVYCETVIRKTGRAWRSNCYPGADRRSQRLAEAVEHAALAARYAPATRDGIDVDVFMVTTAIVTITPQEPLVLVVPNNGVERARYGLLYTAPQRVNQFSWTDPIGTGGRVLLVWMHVSIDAQGRVTAKQVVNASGARTLVVDAIESQIDKMDFIPGHQEGKPVPMLYVEPMYRR